MVLANTCVWCTEAQRNPLRLYDVHVAFLYAQILDRGIICGVRPLGVEERCWHWQHERFMYGTRKASMLQKVNATKEAGVAW